MSRYARLVRPGTVFHITARGNYRQAIFLSVEDRELYLSLFERHSRNFGLTLLGWCLMTNHVHLLAIPEKSESMAQTIKRAHSEYSSLVNRKHHRTSGHLWQSRFYSCPVQGRYVWTALRYIELNPVRAGLSGTPEQYFWSTAKYHTDLEPPPAILDVQPWREVWTPEAWREVLETQQDALDIETLRRATQRGAPLGAPEFTHEFELEAGRSLQIRPVGRPRIPQRDKVSD
ncbi:MAG: transposase [Acidobacteriaceae bacterium]|nr:transposase [Acidobacteriaceae bacterium]